MTDAKQNKTTFLVLLALANDSMHGYEISKFIAEKTKGFFNLPFGSLYPVLHRLEKEKLIVAKWEKTDSLKPKKTYSLSKQGRKALDAEISVFQQHTSAIGRLIPKE